MTNTIIGTFSQRQDAENATYKLRNEGFSTENISIVGGVYDNIDSNSYENTSNQDGLTAGAILGGVAGLLIGASTFAVPGLGIVAAAGPLAGVISGAVAGGVVGALVDMGVPESESKVYQESVKQGNFILTIRTDSENIDTIKNVVINYGATDVNVY